MSENLETLRYDCIFQVNEETSNRRPIMLTFPPEETAPPPKKEQKEENNAAQSAATPSQPPAMDTEMESPSTSEKTKPSLVVKGLNGVQVAEVIRYMSLFVDKQMKFITILHIFIEIISTLKAIKSHIKII